MCAHGVHEVIGHVDSREGAIEGRRIEEVSRHDFRRRRHARGERGRLPRETAKPDSRGFEDGHQPSSDVAGRTRHEYRRALRLRLLRHHRSTGRTSDARSAFSSSARDVSNPP